MSKDLKYGILDPVQGPQPVKSLTADEKMIQICTLALEGKEAKLFDKQLLEKPLDTWKTEDFTNLIKDFIAGSEGDIDMEFISKVL